MTNINLDSDYEFIFTAADARRQQRSYSSYSVLSWSQIFNPSSYYSRNNINARNGSNSINLSNTNNNNNSLRPPNNNNTQPPSYEEAIQQSLDPSTVNVTPLARPTVIHQPLNQVIVSDESQPLLSDPEHPLLDYAEGSDNSIITSNDNNIIKNKLNDPNPEEETQNLGGPSSSYSPLSN